MALSQRPRDIARRFFHMETGRIPSQIVLDALADELLAAERRGEQRILALLGPQARATVEQRMRESIGIPALDGVAQSADDVANQHGRPAAPAGG